jgi:uncharacterized protein (DUF2141 family)
LSSHAAGAAFRWPKPFGDALVLATLSIAAAMFASPPAQSTTLELSFDSRGKSGEVVVALFDSEQDWNRRQGPVRTIKVPTGQPARITGLEPGRYGVMAFLDRNGDGRLNTLPIGLPTEPYGFSRNARGMFGPPGWTAASFELGPDSAAQSIRLR